MVEEIRSRSVLDFGTCKGNANAQCRLPNLAAKHVLKSEVGTAQRRSLCKYRRHADLDLTFLTFRYEILIANKSFGKIKSERSAFACRSHARVLAAGLPRQDHV